MKRSLKTQRDTTSTPLTGVDVVFTDLDGVVYKGADPVRYAIDSFQHVAQRATLGFITNNASRRDTQVAEVLTNMGLRVDPESVITSPKAAVRMLKTLVAPGATVLVVGGDGLVYELTRAGFHVTFSADDNPVAVVQGFAPEIGWGQLAEACFALNASDGDERIWLATNTDTTLPLERGDAPGNGALVAAVRAATGRIPRVAGKPEHIIFDEARDVVGAKRAAFIGDRLDTDIVGANRAGFDSIAVLTGVDGARELIWAHPEARPDYILEDLRGLFEYYPHPRVRKGRVQVGDACVDQRKGVVRVREAGRSKIDLLRAVCHFVWGQHSPQKPLCVPDSVYEELNFSNRAV